ncbi:STAS domain-containing protein [Litoribacter ruber]|uniref:STAS domain-containing protein n=1 Tax=Litoribacter ruber TaxID=702568 RepID=A0AAP2CF27_9BACT|nr:MULTISPECIES: STAS domain-containing protein [Litoribacter]MBS9523308.1 STAS domain-containing protein [Litoribacter alkaliphilus]MBT0813101.1 STAS domain-containing protein [Litoribacter ruber]
MNNPSNIRLSTFYADSISNRESIRIIFDKVSEVDNFSVDFENIDFISRAAAHELAVYLERYQNRGKSISLLNVAPSVNQMLETVAESKKVDYKKATFIERISFKNENEMEAYLLSI